MLTLKTYPYSDPDPVPATDQTRYPYCFFDGTTDIGEPRQWKAVVLENGKVKVTIFPEIGGKVWGAQDKATGRDFIYYNHVVKFRNISQRGPWCSGGIEYNFGLIGHGPWTAAPVSYLTRTNADGSASCFLSETDLATRTTWQVEVNLPADAEGFLTRTTWFNGSGFDAPYYQWMNAAYSVRGNPEFFYPGRASIGHDGKPGAWPVDAAGHELSRYAGNAFGGPKSVHIIDGDNGLYGIWWPGENGAAGFGSAHLNHVTQKYGRKLWLWPLSRAGGIWEDLLTDEDGQYAELQSGRAFNQPEPSSGLTPFKHPAFAAGATDTFEEEWRVVRDRSFFTCAEDETRFSERPQTMPEDFDWKSAYWHLLAGEQLLRQKLDRRGEKELRAALEREPHLAPAHALLAALAVRRGQYAKAHDEAARALAVDTYDPGANYADGMAFAAEGRSRQAAERLGLAAYSPSYRSASFVRVAMLEISAGRLDEAKAMLDKALAANGLDFDALHLQVAVLRLQGCVAEARRLAEATLERLPLHAGLRYELNRLDPAFRPFESYLRGEFPQETIQSVAGVYETCGMTEDADRLYALAAEKSPVAAIRLAYLRHCRGDEAAASALLADVAGGSVAFAFPFRREELPALAWAAAAHPCWKFRYLQAVLLASLSRDDEADGLLDACGDSPDMEAFYLYRASRRKGARALADLRRAEACGGSWRTAHALYRHFAEAGQWDDALAAVEPHLAEHPANKIKIAYATALVKNGRCREAVDYLERTAFLPSELGDNPREAWVDAGRILAEAALARGDRQAAEAAVAKAVSYPENLGVGRPYELNFEPPKEGRNPYSEWSDELREMAKRLFCGGTSCK